MRAADLEVDFSKETVGRPPQAFEPMVGTGTYTVAVSKPGFSPEARKGITLRAGETATLRVKLLVGAEQAEVTVYGTTAGVRADPQIGRRLDSPVRRLRLASRG